MPVGGELGELLAARAARPQAQLVAGCTDVGLWVNKLHMDFAQVLDELAGLLRKLVSVAP